MPGEAEKVSRILETSKGKIEVTCTYAILRETRSTTNQVIAKQLLNIEFKADGKWFTDEMADQLTKWFGEGCEGDPPPWVVEP